MLPQVLNPTLFRLLERQFGQGNVEIANPGAKFIGRFVNDRWERIESGEEYRVNCPFCNDTRKRLYLNHRWATENPHTSKIDLWLMQCWNEHCESEFDNRVQLYEQLFSFVGQYDRVRIPLGKSEDVHVGPVQVEPPGKTVSIAVLAHKQPQHPAIRYLKSRRFDPQRLSDLYSVTYCYDSHFALARDRIIIPHYENNVLVGWQARMVGEWYKGMPPKYFTAPGSRRKYFMYNFDRAIRHQTILIVEGPTDVWNAGLNAMACWGKTMSQYNRQKLISRLRPEQTVVILLDPEWPEDELKKPSHKRRHHIERLYEELRPGVSQKEAYLLKVYLPARSDPGSLDRKYLRQLIKDKAGEARIPVNFTQPK